MLELLLKAGASPDERDSDGSTLLRLAGLYGSPEAAALLEKARARDAAP